MFNRKLVLQDNSYEKALSAKETNTQHGIQDDVLCHLKAQYCSSLCSMFVGSNILDRKTPDNRYFVYSPYCALSEEISIFIGNKVEQEGK